MPAKETAKPSKEPTPTDEPVSAVPAMALASSGSDMEVIKQMLLQMQQQMQNLNAKVEMLQSKTIVQSETHSPTPTRTELHV